MAEVPIEPTTGLLTVSETCTTSLVIESDLAANAFQGQFSFDLDVLTVEEITYHTYIADP